MRVSSGVCGFIFVLMLLGCKEEVHWHRLETGCRFVTSVMVPVGMTADRSRQNPCAPAFVSENGVDGKTELFLVVDDTSDRDAMLAFFTGTGADVGDVMWNVANGDHEFTVWVKAGPKGFVAWTKEVAATIVITGSGEWTGAETVSDTVYRAAPLPASFVRTRAAGNRRPSHDFSLPARIFSSPASASTCDPRAHEYTAIFATFVRTKAVLRPFIDNQRVAAAGASAAGNVGFSLRVSL